MRSHNTCPCLSTGEKVYTYTVYNTKAVYTCAFVQEQFEPRKKAELFLKHDDINDDEAYKRVLLPAE
jgi:hypothetical protein